MARKKKATVAQLMTWYMDYVTAKLCRPGSISDFASENNFEAPLFYKQFDSFKELEQEIFKTLFETSLVTLEESDEFVLFGKKDKLLSLYFTFFENLSLNKEFIQFVLKDYGLSLETLSVLAPVREHYGNFIDMLELQELNINFGAIEPLQKVTIRESSWIQFLFTLKFWLDDTSPDFEKTDVFIEKSLNTSLELIDTKALNNIIDLGKFLYKERFTK
jgi:hypothetical protein